MPAQANQKTAGFVSQAAWYTYRMENGPKPEKLAKIKENGPQPGKWEKKWPKNGQKMGFVVISLFLGHLFPISGRGPFSIFSILCHAA